MIQHSQGTPSGREEWASRRGEAGLTDPISPAGPRARPLGGSGGFIPFLLFAGLDSGCEFKAYSQGPADRRQSQRCQREAEKPQAPTDARPRLPVPQPQARR